MSGPGATGARMRRAAAALHRAAPPLLVAAFVLLPLLLAGAAVGYDLDHDEHQFLVPAAQWAAGGAGPWAAHPFFHLPLQVILLRELWPVWNDPLLGARLLSASAGLATVLLLAGFAARELRTVGEAGSTAPEHGSRTDAAVGLARAEAAGRLPATLGVGALFAFNGVFPYAASRGWNHATSTLAGLAAVLLVLEAGRVARADDGRDGPLPEAGRPGPAGASPAPGRAARLRRSLVATSLSLGAGLCFGLAVGARLTWAPLGLPLALGVVLLGGRGLGVGRPSAAVLRLAAWALGAAVALLPVAAQALEAPARFAFGTFEYPFLDGAYQASLGRSVGLLEPGKLLRIVGFLFERPAGILAAVLAAVALRRAWRAPRGGARGGSAGGTGVPERRELLFWLACLLFVAAGAWAPMRIHDQYHYAPIALLVGSIPLALGYLARENRPLGDLLGWLPAAGAVAVLTGVWSFGSPWRLARPDEWTPARASRVGAEVERSLGSAGVERGPVVTLAPLLPELVGLPTPPVLATGPFAWRVAPLLDPETRRRQGVVGPAELAELVRRTGAVAILVGVEPDAWLEEPLVDFARRRDWTPRRLPDLSGLEPVVWLRRPDGGSP